MEHKNGSRILKDAENNCKTPPPPSPQSPHNKWMATRQLWNRPLPEGWQARGNELWCTSFRSRSTTLLCRPACRRPFITAASLVCTKITTLLVINFILFAVYKFISTLKIYEWRKTCGLKRNTSNNNYCNNTNNNNTKKNTLNYVSACIVYYLLFMCVTEQRYFS